VVLENLNTHTPAALFEVFEPEEARRIVRKLEFHYTPKHASRLNMAEIEISVLDRQCLDRVYKSATLYQVALTCYDVLESVSGDCTTWLGNRVLAAIEGFCFPDYITPAENLQTKKAPNSEGALGVETCLLYRSDYNTDRE